MVTEQYSRSGGKLSRQCDCSHGVIHRWLENNVKGTEAGSLEWRGEFNRRKIGSHFTHEFFYAGSKEVSKPAKPLSR